MNAKKSNDATAKIVAFFREHPGIAGTLIYIQVNAVGVTYSWALFGAFGVNVFDFAEANDFLLAAFREPLSALSAVGMILYVGFFVWFLQKRKSSGSPFAGVSVFTKFLPLTVILMIPYTLFPAYFFAQQNAVQIREGQTDKIAIFIRPPKGTGSDQRFRETTTLIGTTERLLFVLDHSQNQIVALPRARVARIEFTQPDQNQ